MTSSTPEPTGRLPMSPDQEAAAIEAAAKAAYERPLASDASYKPQWDKITDYARESWRDVARIVVDTFRAVSEGDRS